MLMSVAAREWTAERVAGLLKKPKRSPTGWKACCPAHDDSDPSLFLADGSDGGLVAICYAGCEYRAVMDALEMAGMPTRDRGRDRSKIFEEHFQLGPYHSYWDYHDKYGSVVMRVCRWEQPGGKKDIRPIVKTVEGWKWAHHPSPRPLFQLHRLTNEPEAPVILVEGEKTAMAAQKLFPTHVATTWPGGAQATGQVDWEPLRGRTVFLVPDCDQPGRKAMRWVSVHLQSMASTAIVDPAEKFGHLQDGWDLADALREGRNVADLLSVAAEKQEKPQFTFHAPSLERFQAIRPREWIYRKHYMRRMVGVTAAAGGSGKSSVVMVELISIALGVDLLDERKPLRVGKQSVWYHNGEDPNDEIGRRTYAICLHYGIEPDLLAQTFFWTCGRENALILSREHEGSVVHMPATVDAVIAEIESRHVAVLALDPFIATHRISENSNEKMDEVMGEWRTIADRTGAAIEAVHHFRKSNGSEPTADDIRGASSILGAARSARILCPMSRDEAGKAGIDARQRRRFVWEMPGKANMYVATDERTWREMVEVDLHNPTEVYDSDKVGVATAWDMPDQVTSMADELFGTIMSAIRGCSDPLKRRCRSASPGWIGNLIADTLGVDTKDPVIRQQISSQVKSWADRGLLVVRTARDGRQAREVDVYEAVDRTTEEK